MYFSKTKENILKDNFMVVSSEELLFFALLLSAEVSCLACGGLGRILIALRTQTPGCLLNHTPISLPLSIYSSLSFSFFKM